MTRLPATDPRGRQIEGGGVASTFFIGHPIQTRGATDEWMAEAKAEGIAVPVPYLVPTVPLTEA